MSKCQNMVTTGRDALSRDTNNCSADQQNSCGDHVSRPYDEINCSGHVSSITFVPEDWHCVWKLPGLLKFIYYDSASARPCLTFMNFKWAEAHYFGLGNNYREERRPERREDHRRDLLSEHTHTLMFNTVSQLLVSKPCYGPVTSTTDVYTHTHTHTADMHDA